MKGREVFDAMDFVGGRSNISGTPEEADRVDEELSSMEMQTPSPHIETSMLGVVEQPHGKKSELMDFRDGIPIWMHHSFGKDSLSVMLLMGRQGGQIGARSSSGVLDYQRGCKMCEECGRRAPEFDCANCCQLLCFVCTDAIHIIRELSAHQITRFHPCEANEVLPLSGATSERGGKIAKTEPEWASLTSAGVALTEYNPPTQYEQRLHLPLGTKLYFRAEDCGRWSRELLHGCVVGKDHSVRSNCTSGEGPSSLTYFYRVLWLRGVEALQNGFYRANLLLPPPSWPVEIGLFPTRLSAFRAVLTAERLARAKLRRELVSGRWHDKRPIEFPSTEIVNEILDETDATLGREYRTRLTYQDDLSFLEDVSSGTWCFEDWMKKIGRTSEISEELAAAHELDDKVGLMSKTEDAQFSAATELTMLWSPRGRMRFFLLEQRDLCLPEPVRRSLVRSILGQMLFVYVGFAWSRWTKFTMRHRRHELRQRREIAASSIQRWWRSLVALTNERNLRGAMVSPLDALTLYQRRQVEAAKLYQFLVQQWHTKLRHTLRHWVRYINGLRGAEWAETTHTKPPAAWHPSHGISSLPRLPRMYAHKKLDGSVAIDDLKLYKQFRSNHVGPTESSYWIIRHHVLMGVYPAGIPAFRHARRIVSRADYTTSILLQEIGTFVCLAEPTELQSHEANVDTSSLVQLQQKQQLEQRKTKATPVTSWGSYQTPWLFERIVRAKHELLRGELEGAVKICERHAELAQRESDDFVASLPAPADVSTLSSDARSQFESLASKLALAQQNVRKAQETLANLKPLDFVVFSIEKDGVPLHEELFEAFLVGLEDRLRRRERLYVFSMQGHGRTGFVAALLLGRLYGLTAIDALDRAQRLHDCQYAMHGVGPTKFVSSPHAAPQIAMVSQLLARWNDAIYAPVVSENSRERFVQWRAQQRGSPIDKFAMREGFMVSDRVDEATQEAQRREFEALQRVAKRESAAAKLRLARSRQQRERDQMREEDGSTSESRSPR